ncbi:hypothetical protein OG884_18990 [Streptosporangium sp. NBC_01755]|uniref:hypothetical protein n=1 Tax=Streptosporangium sp. NBC_01755 TaxID=2975949 RepID=UPI002DDC0B55|nr:hypothetical protein [Streptosporangium sp. NBC_01755]WSD03896.1 hypothetical protein OG884_18990 [Streptosporangium sp. NBC_01755]
MKHVSGTTAPSAPTSPDLDSLPLLHSRTLQQVPARWPDGEAPSMRRAYDAELAKQSRGA